jgi:hypothetical protein
MASNVWQAASLPYVAGLGPRKAQSLLQAVQAEEFALNRVSLWNEIWKPGNAVFRSGRTLAFIRLRCVIKHFFSSNQSINSTQCNILLVHSRKDTKLYVIPV